MSRSLSWLHAAMLASLVTSAGCNSLGDVMRQYGYTELRPPSNLSGPGTIVFVRSSSPAEYGVICSQSTALGAGAVIKESETATMTLKSKVEGSFKLSADYLNHLQAQADYSSVKNIKLTITNPKVFEIADDQVIAHEAGRTPSCAEAIKRRQGQRYAVSMVKAALQADVKYIVEFTSEANAEVKAKAIEGLKVELGVKEGTSSATEITGNGIFWGVIDDPGLMAPSAPGSRVRTRSLVLPDRGIVAGRPDVQ